MGSICAGGSRKQKMQPAIFSSSQGLVPDHLKPTIEAINQKLQPQQQPQTNQLQLSGQITIRYQQGTQQLMPPQSEIEQIQSGPQSNQLQLIATNYSTAMQQPYQYQQQSRPLQDDEQLKTHTLKISGTGRISYRTIMLTKYYQCTKCQLDIKEPTFLLQCEHTFHINCLLDFIDMKLTDGAVYLKCLCGYKLNSRVLRQIDIENQPTLLTKLFQNQIQAILEQSINKKADWYDITKQAYADYQNKQDISDSVIYNAEAIIQQ